MLFTKAAAAMDMPSTPFSVAMQEQPSTPFSAHTTIATTSSVSRPLLFALNGCRVEIASPDPSMTLLSFLRSRTRFTGTKLSCGEGGCGACLVLLSTYDPTSKQVQQFSINSCLALLCSLDGCSITTIEGLGSTHTGFHAIQQRIAGFHGSQCGFCTPGMCIALYSCLHNSHTPAPITSGTNACADINGSDKHPNHRPLFTVPTLSSEDAQKAIVGNICRCTGYRPIVDACKSFAGDVDVEDLGINVFWASTKEANANLLPPYSRTADSTFPEFLVKELDLKQRMADMDGHDQCSNGYHSPTQTTALKVKFRDRGENSEEKIWIQTSTLEAIFDALHCYQGRSDVKLVVGNTSSGYYKDHNPRVLVDISRVPELLILDETPGTLKVGAAVTIEKLIHELEARPCVVSKGAEGSIARGIAAHLRKVANPHVRHRASVGGNLIMAQQFFFDSDLATLFLAAGATLHLVGSSTKMRSLSMEEFLQNGLLEPGWILESISLPLEFTDRSNAWMCMANGNSTGAHHSGSNSDSGLKCYFKSYRAAPRDLGNVLPHVNAAFLASISSSTHSGACITVADVKLAFGAFGKAHAIRARRVESYLCGKTLNPSILLEAITMLKDELKPALKFAKNSSYKLSLAVGYLSDFCAPLLAASDGALSKTLIAKPEIGAAGGRIHISGRQTLPDWEEQHLIGKAMEKSEAKIQAAGLIAQSSFVLSVTQNVLNSELKWAFLDKRLLLLAAWEPQRGQLMHLS